MVKVSIIIPMYNSALTIINSLESIVNQIYKNYEIIIVDDGSIDNSYNLVKEYIKFNKLEEKIILITQKNSGPSVARNKAIKLARGEYISFLDSDDVWLKDKLQKQVNILDSNKDIALVGTCVKDAKISSRQAIIKISFNKLLFKNYFKTPTVMIRKSVLDEVGMFDQSKKYSEDYNLWLRIGKRYGMILINEELCVYGDGKPGFGYSGLSSNLKEMERGELNNYYKLLELGYINKCEFVIVTIFSYMKYIRRICIVKIRKNKLGIRL